MQKFISYKNIFLLDATGALVTTLLLSQVLARFESVFGMPPSTLYVLAGIAAIFAIYSFLCHWFAKTNPAPYLKAIALANALYCIITFTLVIYLFETLTWLGIAYFMGEIVIVFSLVILEVKMAFQTSH